MKYLMGPLFILTVVFMPQLAGMLYLVVLGDLAPAALPDAIFSAISSMSEKFQQG